MKKNVEIPIVLPARYATVQLFPDKEKRGTRMAVAWLEDAISSRVLNRGDLLLTDNEKSFLTEPFEDLLEANGILHLTYPTYLGCKLDPCDNAFHAHVRADYAKRILGSPASGLAERLFALFHAYKNIPETAVRNYFRHCGLLGNPPADTMYKLLNEGNMVARKFRDIHTRQLIAYLDYRNSSEWREPEERRRSHQGSLPTPSLQHSTRARPLFPE